MNNEEIIRLLFSLLGGGIAVAILNWIRLNRAELRERKINFLGLQLGKLYGPLYYFVCQCEKLFELNKRWDDAYCKEYIGKEWSQDPGTQKAISKEASDIIELRNTYIAEVEKNSENIKEILNNNYTYIDQDDIDIFTLFYEHYVRRKIELDTEGKLKPSIRYYQDVGNISFLRPEFIIRVKGKFIQKKEELEKLSRSKMELKAKKIIAKEGLVIIGLFVAGFIAEILRAFLYNLQHRLDPSPRLVYEYVLSQMMKNGILFIVIIYPTYLFMRFIIWAIKTLRQK